MNSQVVSESFPVDSLHRQLFDDSEEAMAFFRQVDGTVVTVNSAFRRTLELSDSVATGARMTDLIQVEPQVAENIRQLASTVDSLVFDGFTATAGRPVQCRACVVRDNHRAIGLLRVTPAAPQHNRLPGISLQRVSDVDAIVWECSLSDWRFTYISPNVESITGYPASDWLTKPDFLPSIIHPDDRRRAMGFCHQSTLRGTDHELEYRIIRPDGRMVWVYDLVLVLKDDAGRPTGMRGVMVDITQRRANEAALWNSERERARAEKIGALMKVDVSPTGDWLRLSPGLCEFLGYTDDQLRQKRFFDVIHPHDVAQQRQQIQELLDGRFTAFDREQRFVRADGQEVWAEVSCTASHDRRGRVDRLLMYVKDVSERKAAEEALRRSEQSLARAQQIARIGTWEANTTTGRTAFSPETFRILGADESEQISLQQYFDQFVHEDDRDRLLSAHHEAVRTGIIRPMQYRIRRRSDGAIRHVRAEAEFQDPEATRQFGTLQDITVLIETQDRLHASETRYRTIVESTQEWIWETDAEGLITFSNAAVRETLGYRPEELRGRCLVEFLAPENSEQTQSDRRAEFFDERGWSHRVLRWQHRDGSERVLESNGQPVFDRKGQRTGFRGSDRDITDRVAAEENLRQHQHLLAHVSRLSTMGEMVAGIAHEVNQPLAAIAAYADASLRQLAKAGVSDPAVGRWQQQISEQAIRCGDIIRYLRGFVKRGDGQREWVSLHKLVSDSLTLLQTEGRQLGLQVTTDPLIERLGVYVCEVQMQQVLVNLLRNAMDALRDTVGPQLTIRPVLASEEFQICIADNGPGIDEQDRQKLFEAFFSTKEDGMGMGLAISRSIIESHGGKLTIHPDSKRGAEFIIELPTNALRTESDPDAKTADFSRR